ncbi:MAG: peptidylprolyl isomerase [Phycisphaerales bacterium]
MTCVVPPGSSCSPYGALVLCASVLASGSCFAAQDTKPAEPPTTKPAQTQPDDDTAPLVYVLMKTSLGEIVLELNREKAPISVKNFLSYTDKEFYDGTIFHRVISTFMIQGGGFTEDMQKKPTDPPIQNEWKNGLKNVRGSIAMARTPQPDSATAQFFINVVDNTTLDQPRGGAAYAVFGKVVAGMDVVDSIRVVPTTTKGRSRDVPTEPVVIQKVSRLSEDDAQERIDAEKKTAADSDGTS